MTSLLIEKDYLLMNIEEIYQHFRWDICTLTDQDIHTLINRPDFDIQSFICPDGRKEIWEGCAKVISCVEYAKSSQYFSNLFEWLQDINWPGALYIRNYLYLSPYNLFIGPYNTALNEAYSQQDQEWLYHLAWFINEHKVDAKDIDNQAIYLKIVELL